MSKFELLICPNCQNELQHVDNHLTCSNCNNNYQIIDGIPNFIKQSDINLDERTSPDYWNKIWAQQNIDKHLASSRKKIEFYLNLTGLFDETIDLIIKNSKGPINALEVGCGGSQFMPHIIKKLKSVNMWGFDRSFEGCRQAKNNKTNIVCADIFSCPFKKNSFDFVYDFTVVHHFKNPDKLLKIYSKLLKPDGVLVCIVPNLHGFLGYAIDSINVNTMTKISIENLYDWLKELGLKNINVKPIGGIHPLLFITQSYRPESPPFKEEALVFTSNYFFGMPLLAINIPFLFRLNSKMLSPFLIAQGVK